MSGNQALDHVVERGGPAAVHGEVGLQGGLIGAAGPQRQAAADGRLQRVGDVEVVGPGLGPVFPRVRRGVGGDETLLPVGRRALLVVALERRRVIGRSSPKSARNFSKGGWPLISQSQ